MVEMLKKSIFATIGIALMTREKAEELGKKVAEEARLSETEGKQFIDELMKRVEEARKTLEKTVSSQVESALKIARVATRKEFKDLEKRVALLENNFQEIR